MPTVEKSLHKPPRLRDQWVTAVRTNFVPGLILQILALAVLLGYYYWTPAGVFFNHVAEIKLRYGFRFSVVSMALFGGILPYLLEGFQKGSKRRFKFSHFVFFTVFWGIKGAEVDAFYRVQALVFGDNTRLTTIICKVAVDQFGYTPLWALTTISLAYLWKDGGFAWSALKPELHRGFYRQRVLPVLVPTWTIWIPAVAIVYCLKLPLQLPIQNIVQCLWVLIFVVVARESGTPKQPRPSHGE